VVTWLTMRVIWAVFVCPPPVPVIVIG
jgi:hypothetical protein